MNHPKLKISLLGGINIAHDDTAVSAFASRKADALFVYLASNPRPHPRETVADLFWPDNNQSRALANLSVALTSLRKQLDAYLLTERHTVGFNAEEDFWLDTAVFQQAIHQAKAEKQRRGKLNRIGAEQLATAVSLYKGDFLAGFNIRKAPEFEAWVLLEQERLRQQIIGALAELIRFHQGRGQLQDGIQYAQRLLNLDPLQEEAHRQLMQLYAQNNQRPAALAQYEQCAAILQNELGVPPDEETTLLYERLKDSDIIWTPEQVNAPSTKHNIATATTPFIGREPELDQIEAWLAEPNGRLLTIIGQGGMGKTRLAQEAARAQLGAFADGVWFVSLAPLPGSNELVTAVAEAIGLAFTGSTDATHQLINYLASKEMFLILDNFEHMVAEGSMALLANLLQQAPEIKLLITSRERLNLQAESLLTLHGLPFPAVDAPDALNGGQSPITNTPLPIMQYPAIQLFVRRAAQVQPDFNIAGQETAVAKLCQLVDGLPLGIELAATWIRTLSVAEIVTEIERGIDFLASQWRDVAARHRSMRAVFTTSWQMLTEEEKEVFARLSVCRGGFTREAAQQVGGASLPILSSLADKSFLRLDFAAGEQPARYRRHPLLIQFAAEELAKEPAKLAESQRRLAVYVAETLAACADHFSSPKRTAVMALMMAEHENVRFAWQWAIHHEPSRLQEIAPSYEDYLIGAGLFSEGYAQFNLAIEALQAPKYQLLRARLQVPVCLFARILGQTALGRDLVLDTLAILERLPNEESQPEIEARALKQYASLLLSDENNYAEAKKVDEQALLLFRQLNKVVDEGDVLKSLGVNAYYTGNYAEAIRLTQEGLVLQEKTGNQIGQVLNKQVMGLIHTSLGNFTEAIDLFEVCIALAEAANYKVDLPWHHLDLGYAQMLSGQLQSAIETLTLSVQYSLEQEDPQAISGAYLLLGTARLHNGRLELAQKDGLNGLHYTKEPEMQFPFYHAFALTLLGAIALVEDDARQAFDQLTEASELFRKIEHQEYVGWSLPMQLLAACVLKRTRRIKGLAQETAVLIQELEAYLPRLLMVTALAAYCCYEKRWETAVTLYASVEQEPLIQQSQWFQTIAERFLETAVASLSPAQQAAAQAQGQQASFETLISLVGVG